MSKFEYTLPSGATFVVEGPTNATQAEADRIFYEQVAAGSLVGYEPNQTLTSQSVVVTKFALSRLDRGTAGVDDSPILSVIGDLVTVGGESTVTSIFDNLGINSVPQFPDLADVPLQNPITQADIAITSQDSVGLPGTFVPTDIGPLDAARVQALIAQLAKLINQAYNEISLDKGIGRYGFSCLQLESAGYVKPGTSLRFLAIDPEDFISVMSSPGIWTGLNGVTSLDQLLNDPNLQTKIQNQLMIDAYQSLQMSGAISTSTTPQVSLSSGTIYYQGTFQPANTLTTLVGTLGLQLGTNGILTATKSINTLLSSSSGINLSTLSSGAVNSLTSAISNINLSSSLNNINLSSLGSSAISSITNSIKNFNLENVTQSISNRITGDVGALVTNASKFGANLTTNWAAGSLGSLTNIGGLGSITSSLNNIGKMSLFSNTVSNPLGSLGGVGNLSNINIAGLTSLGGLTSGLTSNLGGLTSNLGGLTGSISGLTGGLGNLSNLGNLGNLLGGFNLGGLLGGLGNLGGLGGVFGGGGGLVSSVQFAGGFNNTVDRSTVNSATTRILGNSKIPNPAFEYPSVNSTLAGLDITQAKNILSNSRTGAINQGTGLISGGGIGGGITRRLIG